MLCMMHPRSFGLSLAEYPGILRFNLLIKTFLSCPSMNHIEHLSVKVVMDSPVHSVDANRGFWWLSAGVLCVWMVLMNLKVVPLEVLTDLLRERCSPRSKCLCIWIQRFISMLWANYIYYVQILNKLARCIIPNNKLGTNDCLGIVNINNFLLFIYVHNDLG